MSALYLVTDRGLSLGRPLKQIVLQAVKGGVSMVQLREKQVPTRFFIEEALRVKELLAPYQVPLIINDRVDVALAVAADGVHIGQEDMPYLTARKLMGKQAIIGLSVETIDQVREAEDYDVDYLGVSPIYETPTKTDTKDSWGLAGLAQIRAMSRHRLVAIGGLKVDNIEAVIRAGADSIAVVSALCSASDPHQAAEELNRAIETGLKARQQEKR